MARRLVAEATAVAKLDISDVERGVVRIRELLKGLANKVTIKVGFDQTGIKTDLAKMRTEAAAKPVKVNTDLDTAAATAKLDKLSSERRTATVTVEVATARLEALKAELANTNLNTEAKVKTTLDVDRAASAAHVAAVAAALGPAKVATNIDIDSAAALAGAERAKASLSTVLGDIGIGLKLSDNAATAGSLLADLEAQKLKLAAFADANQVNVPLNVLGTKLFADLAKTRLEVAAALRDPLEVHLKPTPFADLAAEFERDRAGLMALGSAEPVKIRLQTVLERTGALETSLEKALAGQDIVQKIRFEPDFDVAAIEARLAGIKAGRIEFPARVDLPSNAVLGGELTERLAYLKTRLNVSPLILPTKIKVETWDAAIAQSLVADLAEIKATLAATGVEVPVALQTSKVIANWEALKATLERQPLELGPGRSRLALPAGPARLALPRGAIPAGFGPIPVGPIPTIRPKIEPDFDFQSLFALREKFKEIDVRGKFILPEESLLAVRRKFDVILGRPITTGVAADLDERSLFAVRRRFDDTLGRSGKKSVEIKADLDEPSVGRARTLLNTLLRPPKFVIRTSVEGLGAATGAIASIAAPKDARIKIVTDAAAAIAEIKAIKRELSATADKKIRVQLRSEAALQDLYEIGATADEIARARHKLSVDTSDARKAVREYEVYAKTHANIESKINVDAAKALAQTVTFSERASKILGRDIKADVDLQTVGATIKAETFSQKLGFLLGKVPLKFDVDGSTAEVKALGVKERIRALFHLGGGVDIPVGVDVKGGEVAAITANKDLIAQLQTLIGGGGKSILNIGLGSTVQGLNQGIQTATSTAGSGPWGLIATSVGVLTAALAINAAAWTGVGIAAAGAAIPITKFAIDAAQELQGPLVALSRQLQGTQTDFAEFGAKVAQQAITTPFQLATTLRANQRLIGQGLSPQDALDLNKLAADLVAQSGGTDAAFNQVNLALAKLAGRGVLNQRLITSLVTNAPGSFGQGPFLEQIASMKGMIDASSTLADRERARAEVTKMITAREIDADTALKAFKATVEATPGVVGAAEKQVQTLAGALSNVKDALQVGSLTGFADAFRTVGTALPDISGSLAAGLVKIGPAVNDALKDILPTIRPIIASLTGLISTAVRAAGPVVKEVFQIGSNVMAAVGPSIKRIFDSLASFFRDNRGIITGTLVQLADQGAKFLNTVTTSLTVMSNIVALLSSPLDAIKAFFTGLWSGIQTSVGLLLKGVEKVVNLIPGVDVSLGQGFIDAGAADQQAALDKFDAIFKRGPFNLNDKFDQGLFGGNETETFDVLKNFTPALQVLQREFGNAFGPAGISALTSETADVMTGDFTSMADAQEAFAESVQAASTKIAEGLQVTADASGAFSAALGKAFDAESGKIDVGKLKETFRKNAEDVRAQALIVAAAVNSGLTNVAGQIAQLDPAEAVALWRSSTKQELFGFEQELRNTDAFKAKFAITVDDVSARLEAEKALTSIGGEIKRLADEQVPIPVAGFMGVTQKQVDEAKFKNALAYQQIVDFINGLTATPLVKPDTWLSGWFGDETKPKTVTANVQAEIDSATSPGLRRLLLGDQGTVTGVTTTADIQANIASATSRGLRRLLLEDKPSVSVGVSLDVKSPFKAGSTLAGFFDGKPGGAKSGGAVVPVSADATAANNAVTSVVNKANTSTATVTVGANIAPATIAISNILRFAAAITAVVPVTVSLVTNGLFELIATIRRELSKPVDIPVTVNGKPPPRTVTPQTSVRDLLRGGGSGGITEAGFPASFRRIGPHRSDDRIPGFWTGGVAPRGFAKVGEKGPEIIHFPRSGEVLNNATSERLMSAVTANTYSTSTTSSTAAVAVDTVELGRIIAEHLGSPVAVHPPYGDPEAIASAVMARFAERKRSLVPA